MICRLPESFVFVMSPLKTFLFSCWAADPSIQIYQNIFVTPLSREFPINFIFARLLLQMVAPNYCQTPDYLKPSSCQIAADKNKTHIAKYGVFRRRCTIIINEVIVSVFLLNPVKAHSYLIIVADAADAVSVNFSGRCKFLQI